MKLVKERSSPSMAPARRDRQRGVALLITLTWIALMVALIGEFTYGTSVDTAQAANARDELRAHYMARSAVNLSRLLIKIQARFVDPVMNQAQQMLAKLTGAQSGAGGSGGAGSSPMGGLGISLRVTDYAGPLMGFFSGSKEEVAGLGSLIGINTEGIKGLGMSSGRFDAEITAEDGKIDLNCANDVGKQQQVFKLLSGLMASQRFDRLFSEADSSGQFVSRADVARALIDWADKDDRMFTPDGAGTGSEDYRYDARSDKYRAHDDSYDTIEEIKQVRGVSDAFMEAFQPFLTIYPASVACSVNLGAISNKNGGDCTPILMGVIRATVDPAKATAVDPAIFDDRRLYPIASVLCDRASAAGFDSLDTIVRALQSPQTAVIPDDPRYKMLQSSQPIVINAGELGKIAYVRPPRTYRIVASGEAGRVKRKITAIVDSQRGLDHPLTTNPASERAAGVLQYWREE
ncbi:MAG TPA: hypothetical protein VNO55_30900 [Polyangia bacterium]|nr:hypothetical protein [Polyangia bacterium]